MKRKLCKRGLTSRPVRALAVMLVLVIAVLQVQPVMAETLKDIQNKKSEAEKAKKDMQGKLDSVQSSIDEMSEDKSEMEEEIQEIDEELVDVLLSIDVLEGDIKDKNVEIVDAQDEYDAAKNKEQTQHEAMKRRIKFMYEKGDPSYLTLMLQSQSIADLINKVDFTERLYDYDRELLLEYQETKQEVADKKEALEVELSEMEEIEEDLRGQQESLQAMIDEKKATLEDFDSKLSAAKNQANTYKAQIKEQAANIKKIEQEEAAKKAEEEAARKKAEEEARKKAEAAAKAKQTESSGGSSSESQSTPSCPADPGDSSKGAEIARFACQFVGNPYVPGGTSLTEGCDCSGFTSAVYSNFGISIPRSSYAQSAAGREVAYSDIQPGDILYYGGHVAIYVGNNTIVHASTQATGIKYSSAFYRTIITIRRFV